MQCIRNRCKTKGSRITRSRLTKMPMTWAMRALHRKLPASERYPLAPRLITTRVAEKAGVADHLDKEDQRQLFLPAHFGMGTTMGALYGVAGQRLPLPAPLAGAVFGVGVWAGNYLGLLPALDILKPATEHPPRRTGLMIAAHIVWGVTIATIFAGLPTNADQRDK